MQSCDGYQLTLRPLCCAETQIRGPCIAQNTKCYHVLSAHHLFLSDICAQAAARIPFCISNRTRQNKFQKAAGETWKTTVPSRPPVSRHTRPSSRSPLAGVQSDTFASNGLNDRKGRHRMIRKPSRQTLGCHEPSFW